MVKKRQEFCPLDKLHTSVPYPLRAWCAWLTEEHYLEVNPARRIKLVGRQEASKREGLSDTQANALLRQAQVSHDALRN